MMIASSPRRLGKHPVRELSELFGVRAERRLVKNSRRVLHSNGGKHRQLAITGDHDAIVACFLDDFRVRTANGSHCALRTTGGAVQGGISAQFNVGGDKK